jgi:hypothetical protein
MSIDVNPDEDFHVVINGNVLALSLDALSAAYEGEVVQDESLIWQPGLGEWMRLDVVLQHLEQQDGPVEPSAPLDEDTYYVQVAEDEVKQMSLDQLDTAYRADIIDLSTLVWQPGYAEWIPLAVLIGDEPEQNHYSLAPSLAAPAPPAYQQAPASHAPSFYPQAVPQSVAPPAGYAATQMMSGDSPMHQSLHPQAQHPSAAVQPFGHAPSFNPPSVVPAPHVSRPLSSVGGYAPLSSPSSVPNSLPAVATSFYPDADVFAPKSKASVWYPRLLAAAAALAALGVAHRYGAGYELASSLDGSSKDKVWAARVGEPSPNTPYGLNRWLGKVDEKYALKDLSPTSSTPTRLNLPLPEPSSGPSTATASTSSLTNQAEANQQDDTKPATSGAKAPAGAAAAFGAALSNRPAPAKTVARSSSSSSKKYSKPAKKSSGATKSSGHAFDPMNGAL